MSNYQWLEEGTHESEETWNEAINRLKIHFPEEWADALNYLEYMGESMTPNHHLFRLKNYTTKKGLFVPRLYLNLPVKSREPH